MLWHLFVFVCKHQEGTTIEEMLEEDEEQEQDPGEQGEENVQPDEPTTRQLTELLTTFSHLTELLQEYDRCPYPWSIISPSLEKVMNIYEDLYMSRVNACQQSLITRYLRGRAGRAVACPTWDGEVL